MTGCTIILFAPSSYPLSLFLLLAADLAPLLLKLLSCKIEWTAGSIQNETWHHGRTNLEEGHCCWLHLKRWRQSVSHVGLRRVKGGGRRESKGRAICSLAKQVVISMRRTYTMQTENRVETREGEESENSIANVSYCDACAHPGSCSWTRLIMLKNLKSLAICTYFVSYFVNACFLEKFEPTLLRNEINS